jgi:hypothetical protein
MVITGTDNHWNCRLKFCSHHFALDEDELSTSIIIMHAEIQCELFYEAGEFSPIKGIEQFGTRI